MSGPLRFASGGIAAAAHASVDDGGEVADRGGLVGRERLKRGGVVPRPGGQLIGRAQRGGLLVQPGQPGISWAVVPLDRGDGSGQVTPG